MTIDRLRQDESGGPRIAVVGGGISGLAAAHRCVSQNAVARVCLFEASDRLGGIIHTQHEDGYLLELGPDSFITNKPGGVQLCEEVGFSDQLIPTDTTFRSSLVLREGKPLPVPSGFMLMAPSNFRAIIESPVLSFGGKIRLLQEASIPPQLDVDDETLASFVTRRFGREALERLVQPLVGGIYTSDPDKLSLRATLPRFLDMEAQYGSVIKATMAEEGPKKRPPGAGSGARYGLFATAKDGLGSLVDHVAMKLRKTERVEILMNTGVESVTKTSTDDACSWTVTTVDGKSQDFDSVIFTGPAYTIAAMLSGDELRELKSSLVEIVYASSAIVLTGHRLSDFTHPLNSFGLVIPAIESRKVLAVSFSSRKFPDRAPEGSVLLRTFVGGAMQAELLQHSDAELGQIVSDELGEILGMKQPAQFAKVVRYNKAMPQYHIGHLQLVDKIERLAQQQDGLYLAGSAYRGVGIPDTITSGRNAADAALSRVR